MLLAFVLLIIAISLILVVLFEGKPQDRREMYFRDSSGLAFALMVRGSVGNVPNHEEILHDGTPHQNPVVEQRIVTKRALWIFPYAELEETRWYPLTIAETSGPNLRIMQQRIHRANARGKDIRLVVMSEEIERRAQLVENNTQRGKGVERLTYNQRGKPI